MPLKHIEDGAMKRLQEYSWPGNVRELQSVIRSAVVRSRKDPKATVLRSQHIDPLLWREQALIGHFAFDKYPTWKDAEDGFHRAWIKWASQQCPTAAELGRRFRVDQRTIKKYRDSQNA